MPGTDGIRAARARKPLDPWRPAQPDNAEDAEPARQVSRELSAFRPSVLREDVADWFDHDGDSPYMLVVADVAEKRRTPLSEEDAARVGTDKVNAARSEIPAITHVDYSARLQTVHRETNPRYHALISAFKAKTGCPVLVNTSFNVRGEPIACTPEDAFRCLMGTEIEVLVVGNCFLRKERQNPVLKLDYRNVFDPD